MEINFGILLDGFASCGLQAPSVAVTYRIAEPWGIVGMPRDDEPLAADRTAPRSGSGNRLVSSP
jgi:hypothetical protein